MVVMETADSRIGILGNKDISKKVFGKMIKNVLNSAWILWKVQLVYIDCTFEQRIFWWKQKTSMIFSYTGLSW